MSSIQSDHSSIGADQRRRLLRATAPILRERFGRQQIGHYDSISKDHSIDVKSGLSIVTDQPTRQPSSTIQHQRHKEPQLMCGSPSTKSSSSSNCRPHEPSTSGYKSRFVLDAATSESNNNNLLRHRDDLIPSYGSASCTNEIEIVDPKKKQQPRLSTIDEMNVTRSNHLVDYLVSSNDDRNNLTCTDKQLVEKIKAKFSLSRDTSIPRSFILKQKFKHFQPLKDDDLEDDGDDTDELILKKIDEELDGLSRVERQQSLSEIGFGRAPTYVKSHVLGSGTYSIVYKGISRLTNKLVALKEIHLERDEGIPFTAIREVSILKQLKHCNIITLHDIISTSKALTLVFEYVDRDLRNYMDQCDHKIHTNNVRLFLYQLLRAISYCHSKKILHRDLKPQNILISSHGELKLADFGLARAKSIPTKTFTDEVVTLWYRPPDVLLGNTDYGTSIDMWGVGCIFFEMIAGFTLFTGIDPKKQIECIFEIIGTPSDHDWPGISADLDFNSINIPYYFGRDLANMAPRLDNEGINLLGKLLKCNPNSRISSSDAIRHDYFAQNLPGGVYELKDSDSIFSVSSVDLVADFSLNDTVFDSFQNMRV